MTYDTGFVVHGQTAREHLDPGVVRRELAIIRDDLHCNAVQIIGGDPDRLELAAGAAAELGLEVWFRPIPWNWSRSRSSCSSATAPSVRNGSGSRGPQSCSSQGSS